MKTVEDSRRGKVLVGAAILTVGAAAFGLVYASRIADDSKVDMPKDLTLESLKAGIDNPVQMRERVHQAFQREDLTDEQRRQLHDNIRQIFHEQMDKRMDEYFTADKPRQASILDRHLDEMVSFMKERERAAENRQRSAVGGQGSSGGPGGGGSGAGPVGGPGDGRGWHRDGQPPSQAEQKERSESRDPDAMARRMAYFTAIRQRAEQRGIEMPFGPPGRGGPR